MAVFLAHGTVKSSQHFDGWVVGPGWKGDCAWPGKPMALEEAVERHRPRLVPTYLDLCHRLASENGARLSHTPSAATNASDLLDLMAWTAVIEELAAGPGRYCVFCDDPWVYRHLRNLPGVEAQPLPPLWPRRLCLALRGLLARCRYGWRALRQSMVASRGAAETGGVWLLTYPHSAHTVDHDAYFGDLAQKLGCRRILHVDGPSCAGLPSLAAWGNIWRVFCLPWAVWRPSRIWRSHWLVERAAAIDGATAQGAAIAWQIECQQRWLLTTRPQTVAWPWENHGWERSLVDQARSLGCRTVGYQHTVVGRTELNHAAGLDDSVPDKIICVGRISHDQLHHWGHPLSRLVVGGGLRHRQITMPRHDPTAPVFMALPGDLKVARQMVAAAPSLGRMVLVRPHPVYDVPVPESDLVRRSSGAFECQPSLSAVIYAATTVGLESVIAGLPTVRFVPSGCIALDILPNNISLPAASASELASVLAQAGPPPKLARDHLFAPVDYDVWRFVLLETSCP